MKIFAFYSTIAHIKMSTHVYSNKYSYIHMFKSPVMCLMVYYKLKPKSTSDS